MPTQFLFAKIYFQDIFAPQKLIASCIVRQSRIHVQEATNRKSSYKSYIYISPSLVQPYKITIIFNNHDDIL